MTVCFIGYKADRKKHSSINLIKHSCSSSFLWLKVLNKNSQKQAILESYLAKACEWTLWGGARLLLWRQHDFTGWVLWRL